MSVFSVLLFSFFLLFGHSHPGKPSDSAYHQAAQMTRSQLYRHVYHLRVQPQWIRGGAAFFYHAKTRSGMRYFTVSLSDFTKRPTFHRKRLADSLSAFTHQKITARQLHISNLRISNPNRATFTFRRRTYRMDFPDYTIQSIKRPFRPSKNRKTSTSPNHQYQIFLKQDNLYLKNLQTQTNTPLTTDGTKYYIYGSYYGWGDLMKGENQSPQPHFTAQWSPNSQKILTQIMDARKGEKMYLLNWAIDTLYRPALLSYYRASPGDTNDVKYIPVIFDVHTHKITKIDLPASPHYMGINLHWTKDSKHLYGLYYHRGYKRMDIIEVQPETGKVRTLFSDTSKTYVENKVQFHYLAHQNIAFFTSEKSGWNQIYRLDWSSGKVHPVTEGSFVVHKILAIDNAQKEIYFTASGKKATVNPYFQSFHKVHFDGSGLTSLTPEPQNHDIALSPNHQYFVDNRSTATHPTVSLLRRTADGHILMRIDSTDIKDLLHLGWHPPQVFTATARDHKTTIYSALWKPTHFDPNKSYPIIDYSYTGPQTYVFPNTFSKGLYSFYSSAQALAELGFIVMQVDGMGSAGRSKAFHNRSYKNIGQNLKDHVLAIRQLGNTYSWIDTSRVGIYGHSAGGYDAAHALMAFNDCYKVAVAESGDHDWRIEKAWWPEMFVGWPVDSIYQQQSNITMAPQLKGKLLLIHGGLDENVNPMETFKLSEALIKAHKYFDLLIIPSAHHGYPATYQKYVRKKRWNYFVQNLLVHPPEETVSIH